MLIAKQEPRLKPTCIAKLYGMHRSKDYAQMLVEPERILFDCYKSLLVQKDGQQVTLECKEMVNAISIQDEMYSEYPCLLVGNRLIWKNNINSFLKQVFDVNLAVPDAKKSELDRLETLCMTQLNLVTVSASFQLAQPLLDRNTTTTPRSGRN